MTTLTTNKGLGQLGRCKLPLSKEKGCEDMVSSRKTPPKSKTAPNNKPRSNCSPAIVSRYGAGYKPPVGNKSTAGSKQAIENKTVEVKIPTVGKSTVPWKKPAFGNKPETTYRSMLKRREAIKAVADTNRLNQSKKPAPVASKSSKKKYPSNISSPTQSELKIMEARNRRAEQTSIFIDIRGPQPTIHHIPLTKYQTPWKTPSNTSFDSGASTIDWEIDEIFPSRDLLFDHVSVSQNAFCFTPPLTSHSSCRRKYGSDISFDSSAASPTISEMSLMCKNHAATVQKSLLIASLSLQPANQVSLSPQAQWNCQIGSYFGESQDIREVAAQVGSTDLGLALEALVQFGTMILNEDVSNADEVVSKSIDTFLAMVVMQICRLKAGLSTVIEAQRVAINNYLIHSLPRVTFLYTTSIHVSARATKEIIQELTYNLVSLLTDPGLSALSHSIAAKNNIRDLIYRIIDKSDPSCTICAMIRLMNQSLIPGADARVTSVVMQGLSIVLKKIRVFTENGNYDWNLEAILLEFDDFMQANPLCFFRNKGYTPLKIIQEVLQSLISNVGPTKVQEQLNKMLDVKSGEAGIYIQKGIQKEFIKRSLKSPGISST